MAERIPQNTSLRIPLKGVLTSDHLTPAVGLSPVVTISKNGGAFTNPFGGVTVATEMSNGWYYFQNDTGDTNTPGPLIIRATAATMDPIEVVYTVVDTAAENAVLVDAVWDEDANDHTLPNSTAERLTEIDNEVDIILEAVLNIGTISGSALNTPVIGDNTSAGIPGVTSDTTFVGTQTNTFNQTNVLNGVVHSITNSASAIDIVYQFSIGGSTTPIAIVWAGYLEGVGKSIDILIWNHINNGWDNIGTVNGQGGTNNITKNIAVYARDAGTSFAELGKIYVRFMCNGQDNTVLHTDQMYVTYAISSQSVGYAEGAVWVDTVAGTDGTELYVNGTADKPCLHFADALTIAAGVGLRRFRIVNNSTIVLTAPVVHSTLIGHNWALLLNNQDIHGCYIEGAVVVGINNCTVDPQQRDVVKLYDCTVASTTFGNLTADNCLFVGNITTLAGASYNIFNCVDALPGTTDAPVFHIASGVEMSLRGWHGGVEIDDIVSGSTVSIDGAGRVIIGATCTGGSITVRGPFKIQDLVIGGFQGTLTDTERWAEDQSIASVGTIDTTGISAIVAGVWGHILEGTLTTAQAFRGIAATAFGKVFGAPTSTISIRDTTDSKDRIVATTDANGNRTTITTDLD